MKFIVNQCIFFDLCGKELYLINIYCCDVFQESGVKLIERNVIGNVKIYYEWVFVI